ncbi:MAG: hypothetical protein V1904_10035 [Bacteroidota bacterium]
MKFPASKNSSVTVFENLPESFFSFMDAGIYAGLAGKFFRVAPVKYPDANDSMEVPNDTLKKKKGTKHNNNVVSANKYIRKKIPVNSPFSNSKKNEFVFWKLLSISGEVKAKGLYREQQRLTNDIYDTLQETYITGGVLLNTSSYFIDPDFLTFDVDAGYNPESNKEKHIVVPDRSETNSLKKLGLSANFFRNKKVNLIVFSNFDENYQNRENLTNIKSKTNQWGANLNVSNKILPVTANFSRREWKQTETETGREFKLDEMIFRTGIVKSFSTFDKNTFEYSHNEYRFINENDFLSYNRIDELNLNDKIYLDAGKKQYFNSIMSYYSHNGKIDFTRFQAFETLSLKLRKNLVLTNNYNLFNTQFETSSIRQNSAASSLEHKLFESLNSKIFIEYNNIKQTFFKENKFKSGVEFKYNKIIPIGKLCLYYKYYRYHQNMDSDPVTLQINDEEVFLADNQLVLLSRPYIDINTVVVKDITNTIIYQINLDYILVPHNNFIEIRRIPGGLIPNNSTVYVDYSATQPGDYKYDANGHYFSANLSLFKDKLDIYYRMSSLDYTNLFFTDFLTLNYFNQNIVGSKLDFGFINFGAEYDSYKSTIIPYTMMRYFINVQKNFNEKILFALSGNKQNYHLTDENIDQEFSDITGMFAYSIFPQTKLNIDVTYRKQKGAGIDLDMYTAKSEITTRFRQLYFNLGAELYKRNYVDEKIKFRGLYFQISRKF